MFGTVAPLFVISLLWERFDFRSSRLFRSRTFTWRIGRLRRTISATTLASGTLLALMGAATMYIGLFKDSMPSPHGWQASLSATLQHYGTKVTHALSFVPGWIAALLLVLMIATLARHALRQLIAPSQARSTEENEPDPWASDGAAEPEADTVHEYLPQEARR